MPIEVVEKKVVVKVLKISGCTVPVRNKEKAVPIWFEGNQCPVKVYPAFSFDDDRFEDYANALVKLRCTVCDRLLWNKNITLDPNARYYEQGDHVWVSAHYDTKAIKNDDHYVLLCKEGSCSKVYEMSPFSFEDKINKSNKTKVPKQLDAISTP